MRVTAWPGNQRASAVHTNVPALHDDADFYEDVSASLKISGSGFCYKPPPKQQTLPCGAFLFCGLRLGANHLWFD
jgi:hypothetical protein